MNRNAQFVSTSRALAAFAVLPLSLAVSQALAQTANVTLYGIVDVGVQHVTGVKGVALRTSAMATRRCLCLRAGLRRIPAVSAIVRCPARNCPTA